MKELERMKEIIKIDKNDTPKYIKNAIKSDIFFILQNYFDIEFENIDVDISLIENEYQISIQSKADKIKLIKSV